MDDIKRENSKVPFNYEWAVDLLKVLHVIWLDGRRPELGRLRAETHTKIPGSCKNKAVLALAIVNLCKPAHEWVAWTCWRMRSDKEAQGRYPNKALKECSFTQLHCVCCHT